MQTPAAFMAPLAIRMLTCLLSAALLIGTVAPALADSTEETVQTTANAQHNPFSPYIKDDNSYLTTYRKLSTDQQQQVMAYFERARQLQGLTEKQIGLVTQDGIAAFYSINQHTIFNHWLAQRPDAPLDSPIAKAWLKKEPFVYGVPAVRFKSINKKIPNTVSDEQIAAAEKMCLIWKAFKDEQIAEAERRSAEAKRRSAEAERRSAEAERRSAEAKRESAEAKKLTKALREMNKILRENQ